MLDNLHTYAFLVNENVGVEETNYYALNPEAKRDQPMVLGNVLRCKNGCDSGLCGTSPFCSMCTIRQHISKAFQAGKDFNNVESHMQLYTPDHNVVDTDVVVGGKYVMINDKPHLVVDVKDVTQEKMLENLYIEEKEKSFLDVKRLRGVLEKLASNITSPFNTLNGYVDMFKKAKTEEERLVELDGVFVQIGLSANSSVFRDIVETNRPGEIVIDAHCRTNVTGIYAAGDVSTVPYKQIIISMGEGAKAALSAFDDRVRGII